MISRRALIIGAALLGLAPPALAGAFAAFNAYSLPSGGGGGSTPTLVQHVGSTLDDNNGEANNNYKFCLPNVTLTNNFLLLEICYPYSASRTVSITDSTGDTWAQAGSTTTDSVNQAQRIYYIPAATAALHTLTITFDASIKAFSYEISEFYNVATSSPLDGTKGAANSAAPNVAVGSYTPTTNNDANGGHLVVTYARSNDRVGTLTANMASAIVPTASASLLSADNTCSIPGAASYVVQATNGAINPGFTITQSSSTNFVTTSVALKAAAAGTAPGAGIRIKRILHTTWTAGPSVFICPCDGNLLVTGLSAGNNLNAVSSVTDSNSQTYTNPGAAGEPQVFYKQNATPSNSLKITYVAGGPQFSMRFHDIVGAQTSSFNAVSGANGANPGSGNLSLSSTLTPTVSPGLSISTGGFGTGPGTGASSPVGSVFDLDWASTETDQSRMENADALGHLYYSSTATQTWVYAIGNASRGSTAFFTNISFI